MINIIFVGFIIGSVFVYYYPQEGAVVVETALAAVDASIAYIQGVVAKIG